MSLKPRKKSDRDKGWMRERKDRRIQIQPEYHLIVTEGTKTEPLYFQAIKDTINERHRDKIQLNIYGEGYNTLGLFERARQRVRENTNGYQHVWVVYDTDDFPADHINRTAELCEKNSNDEIQYHATWSNQCIELWYLLHFGYFHSDIDRKEYWPKLTEWLNSIGEGDYSKNRADMYTTLRPLMDAAIANAKRLDCENAGRAPATAAPGTKVYQLVEKLRPYLMEN